MEPSGSRALVPLTVKMLADDSTLVDGLSQFFVPSITVRLVGRVLDVHEFDLNSEFMLDDGTGVLPVNYWYPIPGQVPIRMGNIRNGCYADVVGKAVKSAGRVALQAFSTRKVNDYNEITHHFLYTIESSLVRQPRLVGCQKQEIVVYGTSSDRPSKSKDVFVEGPSDLVAGGVIASATVGLVHDVDGIVASTEIAVTQEDSATTSLRCNIMTMIVRRQNEEDMLGVPVSQIVKELGVEEGTVREALRQLHDVGEVYETVDTDHYAAT